MTSRVSSLTLPRWLKKTLILTLICGAMVLLVNANPGADYFNKPWIDSHIRGSGVYGVLLFLVIGMVASALGSPRQMVAFLGGYAFGFLQGALYSTLAVTLGCLLTLLFSRLAARPYIRKRYAHRVGRIDRFLAHQPFTKTVVIRLLPVGNNFITNLIAGVTQVGVAPFVLGSMVGYFPQMAIFALMGKGIVVLSYWKIALSIGLFIISSVLSLRLYKQYRAQRLTEMHESVDEHVNTSKKVY